MRSDFEEQAIQRVKALWHTYLISHNVGEFRELFSRMPDNFVMIGTGKHEMYDTKEMAIDAVIEDQHSADGICFEILDEWYAAQSLSDEFCMVYGTLWAREKANPDKKLLADMDTRFSVLCRKEPNGRLTFCNLHHSVPNAGQQCGEYYPRTLVQQANEAIEKNILLETRLHSDSLTGLYNRMYMENFVDDYLSAKHDICAFFMLDLDNFKAINDNFGHLRGDKVLRTFGNTLRTVFRKDDCIGRMGGDEFAVFMTGISSPLDAKKRGEKLLRLVEESLLIGEYPVTCSIGISLSPMHGSDFQQLYEKADKALYQAKKKGKNRCFVWEE